MKSELHVSEKGEVRSFNKYRDNLSSKYRYNLSVDKLVEAALSRGEGILTSTGALRVLTGKYTGRSPKDRFIVDEPSVCKDINWGAVNKPFDKELFSRLYSRTLKYLENREVFIFDGYAGADHQYRLPLRVVNEFAWQNLFARQLFIGPAAKDHCPEFTIICVPGLKADPVRDGTNSEAFIIISFEEKVVLIGGTEYAGEIKKSVFSVLNYLLPHKGVLPMHCSANVGQNGDVALFFGLSGTGKTTLSADPNRHLIGDDEHGWSENGIFNFEGGCYAKCIGLKKEKEPQVWNAIRFGAVLENVVVDPVTGTADYDDDSLTENTRAAYPVEYIPRALIPGVAGHPKVVVFLTADAFGVLPPVSRLTKDQAMFYFLSGYTSKLAGTERGINEPEAAFSPCFGAPFMPLCPGEYAKMLGRKIETHNAGVYLVNTGWSGGPYGTGQRISLSHTRSIITAILNGTIEKSSFSTHPIFNLGIPDQLDGVPTEILSPRQTWQDRDEYDHKALELAARFRQSIEAKDRHLVAEADYRDIVTKTLK
jgi:phosphoenolpyruvate carboxykinase (ATP)